MRKHEASNVRSVLCAVDVERSGSTALSMASLLAERFHASVDALYATPSTPKFDNRAARVRRLISEHNAQERLTGMLASLKGRVCVSSFVTRGNATPVILTHSERQGSDLIVMTSSPHRRFAGGPSTIAPVTALAPCAVLTVGARFQPAPLRRILLPIAPAGAEPHALSWVSALAARFDAEVGVLRIGQPRSGLWKIFSATAEVTGRARSTGVGSADVLAALRPRGIHAYEVEHPGGGDTDAVSQLCGSGAFDAVVMGLPAADESRDTDAWVGALRLKTSAPVLSVRTLRPRMLFASSYFEPRPRAVAGADWAQP
jgi:nucleotide-binding universal stress UspA family protein